MLIKIISLKLLFNPDLESLQPEDNLRASGEMFLFMIILSWIITFLFNPIAISSNPALPTLGYYNLSVGYISVAPSKYFSLLIGVFGLYFSLQYNRLDILRTKLTNTNTFSAKAKFSIFTNLVYIFSLSCVSVACFLNPLEYAWTIMFLFGQYVFSSTLVSISNLLESEKPSISFRIIIYAKAVFSILFIANLFFHFLNQGVTRSAISMNLYPMLIDYIWTTLFFVESFFPIQSEVIKVKYSALFEA